MKQIDIFNTKKFSVKELKNMNTTKGDLFKNIKLTFDYALPQGWLNHFIEWSKLDYYLVLGTTVWVYPESIPVSLCIEVQNKINDYMKK